MPIDGWLQAVYLELRRHLTLKHPTLPCTGHTSLGCKAEQTLRLIFCAQFMSIGSVDLQTAIVY